MREGEKGKMFKLKRGSILLSQCRELCDKTPKCKHFEYCPNTGFEPANKLCRLFDKKVVPDNKTREELFYDCSTYYEWNCENGSNYYTSTLSTIYHATWASERVRTGGSTYYTSILINDSFTTTIAVQSPTGRSTYYTNTLRETNATTTVASRIGKLN